MLQVLVSFIMSTAGIFDLGMICLTSCSAGVMFRYSSLIRLICSEKTSLRDFRSARPAVLPRILSARNSFQVSVFLRCGGSSASFLSSTMVAFFASAAFFALRLASTSGLTSFFGFGLALGFAATFFFFACAVAFFAFTCLVAASSLGDLAARLTARFTGREGSPTAFLGRPGLLVVSA